MENWRSPADCMAWTVQSPEDTRYQIDVLMAGPADVEVSGPEGSFMLHATQKWNKYTTAGSLCFPRERARSQSGCGGRPTRF